MIHIEVVRNLQLVLLIEEVKRDRGVMIENKRDIVEAEIKIRDKEVVEVHSTGKGLINDMDILDT